MITNKIIYWVGSSYNDLLLFPTDARRQAGFQLSKLQAGLMCDDWKSFKTVGPGVQEIRVTGITGAFRIIYLAKFEEAIHVLHCFQKKTPKTSKKDKEIATARYKAVMHNTERKNG